MRLLECETQKLCYFSSDKKYAILSHTWYKPDTEEVSFAAVENEEIGYMEKKGWHKIKNACRIAKDKGYNYLWVDTVCIDKSSSAELSESLNSMFEWYHRAEECFVYLEDLERGMSDIRNCRWFKRGWTLQEMIAPQELLFYDQNWEYRYKRSDILDELNRITHVDKRALQGGDLMLFSVARKMSWASGRETMRVEDRAYSLLGIFGISMPMLYGEGERAFVRLQGEIIKQSDDESILAWKTPTPELTLGLFATTPDVFRDSADIVPCLPPEGGKSMNEPMTLTGRGVRLMAPLTETPGPGQASGEMQDNGRQIQKGVRRSLTRMHSPATDKNSQYYLLRLNCKRITFRRQPGERVGIVVKPVINIPDSCYQFDMQMYRRYCHNELHTFRPKEKPEPRQVYVLKETITGLDSHDIFFIRTMPKWPSGKEFQLKEPPKWWYPKNDMFQRQSEEVVSAGEPFALLFHREDNENHSFRECFEISMDRIPWSPKDSQRNSHNQHSFWCGAKYGKMDEEWNWMPNLEQVGQDKDKKSVEITGAGVKLACSVAPEILNDRQFFVVDLLVVDKNS